jgi:hypothetical protein
MRRTYVLIALTSLALGLVGQRPCAMAPEAPAPSESACHEPQDHDSSNAGDCDPSCQKACQPSMVLTSALPAAGVLVPALDAPRVLATRVLPLVSHAIDHIPLA